jgi:3-hydroxyisobutyrate dehydrogenase-like beta-hydroxyacid dehydrogenase
MTSNGKQKVAVIGLGIMGISYARNLRKSGFEVTGFDISAEARDALKACGGEPQDSARAAVEAGDCVLLALPSVNALHAVVAEITPALKPGLVLAEMGTLPLEAKEAARSTVDATGAVLLDCPVSGTGAQAAKGDLVVFISGDAEAGETLRPVFEGLARDVRHVGPFGAGMKLKYVANLLVSIHNLAAAEALLLAERSGLDLQMTFDAIAAGAGTSRMFEVRGPLMISGEYEPATMKMDVYIKDVMMILEHARSTGTAVPLMAATLPYYTAALAQGRHKQDTGALFHVMKQMSRQHEDNE